MVGYLGFSSLRSPQQEDPAPPAEVARGHYAFYCADCHGADMDGGMASSLVDGRWAFGDSSTAIFRAVADGLEADGMPAFGAVLTPVEIDALVALMRTAEAEPAP